MTKNISIQEIFELLACSDLRSVGYNQQLIKLIASEEDFDTLFSCLFHQNQLVVMRAVDAIEKISLLHPSYLAKHKIAFLSLCEKESEKELAVHLALLAVRIPFTKDEIVYVFDIFRSWVLNVHENRIVRVNALQALYEFSRQETRLKTEFERIVTKIEKEKIPALYARIKKIRKLKD